MKLSEDKKVLLNAKKIIKVGDRIRCTKCLGQKRVFTFSHWTKIQILVFFVNGV